ncbi:MAG: M17 family peptidase N-terminal domain-containing protein, partial [Burkholderiaceae bacterium]
MEITLASGSPDKQRAGVIVAGAFADGALTPAAKALDAASGGKLAAVLKQGDLDEAAGSTLMLHGVPGVTAERVLLVSLGKKDAMSPRAYRDALGGVAKALANGTAADAALALSPQITGLSLAWRVQTAARLLADGAYRFDYPRAKKDAKSRGARKVVLLIGGKADAKVTAALKTGLAIAEGMALTKDLGNLGGNVCNPAYLADTAKKLGKEFKFGVEVLERADMEKLGMGSL